MKQTIFGIILGVLLVLVVNVIFEIYNNYKYLKSNQKSDTIAYHVDIDGIKYRKNI